jgi:HEAT repeat protein/beta-lactamase regulating signal transducer with metallopeptidase domain
MTTSAHPLIVAALQGTALLLLVATLAWGLRRASAASRHFVWSLGLAGLLLLPVLATALPWRLAILPAPIRRAAETVATLDPTPSAPQRAAPVTLRSAPPQEPAPSPATRAPLDLGAIALGLWLIGVAFGLGRLVVGVLVVARLVRRAEPVTDSDWLDGLAWAAGRLGVSAPVRLLRSDATRLPLTAGAFRPIIVLPRAAAGWTMERRRAVLLHELAHVRRLDLPAQLVAQAACALYWFHPLAWIAARRLRAEGERACDDLVLIAGTRASEYAAHLLHLVRHAGRMAAPVLALPMAQRSDFEGRLLAILEPGIRRHPPTRRAATFSAAAILVALVPLAALGTAQAPPLPGPSPAARPRPSVAVQASPTVVTRTSVNSSVTSATTTSVTARLADWGQTERSTPVLAGTVAQAASPTAVRGLIAALGDQVPEVRRAAGEALGQLKDSAAVAALMEALRKDTDPEVRKAAAWSLGQIQDPRAVPALLAALRDDRDVDVRRQVVWALGQIEDASAVEGLGAATRDADREVRAQAVWALGQIQSSAAVPALAIALRDSSADVRKQAAWALGQIQSADAIDPLGVALADRNADVREQAVWALGQIQNARAVPGLTAALRDSVADVRKQAAWALGQIQRPEAVEALVVALKDRNDDVRQQAAWALGQIQSPSATAGLAAALHDPSVDVRRQVVWALGQLEAREAVPALIQMLKDSDAEIRRAAIHALGQIGDPSALDALVAALRDSDVQVRRAAAQALGRH